MAPAQKMLLGFGLALAWALPALAHVESGDIECGSVAKDAFGADSGPYDYRTTPVEKRRQVEKSYFLPLSSQPMAGQGRESRERMAADLDAMLRVFPNHPRALMAMADLARQENTDRPRGSRYSMGCWYDRAVRFAPTDVQMRLAYGYWLAKKGERAAAVQQLDRISGEAQESDTLSYNLGLAYCEAQEYDKALAAAHRAYALGYTLPGLRNRLISVGKWREAGKRGIVPVGDSPEKD